MAHTAATVKQNKKMLNCVLGTGAILCLTVVLQYIAINN